MKRVRALAAFLGVTALIVATLVAALYSVPTSARRPWDFETYWYAADAASRGLNPYNNEDLVRLAARPVGMPFIYPPVTLLFFAPFTSISLRDAEWLWLVLKVLALAGVVQIWRRYFLPTVPVVLLCIAAAFGFNGSAVWDLKTGNVTIMEHLLLWLAFTAYLLERRGLFALCLVAASVFKLLPAAFLVLLLVPAKGRKPDWKVFGWAAGSLLLLILAPYLVGPPWARGYLHNLSGDRPWSTANPSALGLIDTLLNKHGGAMLPSLNLGLWLAYVGVIIAASMPLLRRAWRAEDPRLWVMTATSLFVLLNPRPMAYCYLLAVPAMFYFASPMFGKLGGPYMVALLLSTQSVLIPALGLNYANPWMANLPFLLLAALWVLSANYGGWEGIPVRPGIQSGKSSGERRRVGRTA